MPVNGNSAGKPQSDIKIAHLNARSIKNRDHYILTKNLLAENDFHIFTVSETWLDNSITDLEVEIPGYDVYRLDRHEKTGGGVCAYVRESYKTKHLYDLCFISSAGFHQLWLQVQVGRCKSIVICTVYRPPNSDLNCFDAEFGDALISALSLNHDVYVLGDPNCNLLNPQDHGSLSVMNFCSICNLTQVIKQPTRITETSETCNRRYPRFKQKSHKRSKGCTCSI